MSRTKIQPRPVPRQSIPTYELYETRAGWVCVRIINERAEIIERFETAETAADFLWFLKLSSEARQARTRLASH